MTSQASGYVTFEKYSYRFFNVPSEYVIMVTLRTNVMLFMGHLFYRPQEAEVGKYLPKKVHTPYILHGPGYLRFEALGFNCPPSNCSHLLLFSYLPVQHEPHKLANALFNCSVEYYFSFKMHLQCDWKYDCDDGRDEREQCPSRGPDCQGLLQSCTECYSAHSGDVLEAFNSSRRHFPDKVSKFCRFLGGVPGIPKCRQTPGDKLEAFANLHSGSKLYTGLYYGDMSLPNMYRNSIVDESRYVFHHTVHTLPPTSLRIHSKAHVYFLTDSFRSIENIYKAISFKYYVTCQFSTNNSHFEIVRLPKPELKQNNLISCKNNQMTFAFLVCGSESICDQTDIAICTLSDDHDKQNIRKTPHASLALFPSFICTEYSLSFSQVCDFRYDCPDGSDESFCQYSLCVGSFRCLNGQCISYDKWCDPITHCLDDSDLRGCNQRIKDRKSNRYFRRSPVLINFDGTGLFQSTVMAVNESCPESHYRCPGELNDCLPVYTRCNELHDCAGYEDEKECETMICPGFFRCRKSSICVHDDHLCDGWPHCPLHDDEMGCESTCPIHCLCLGHSFLCPRSFHARLFPDLRYLDGTGSGMTPSDFSHNSYLIHLILANCSVALLSKIILPNLRYLDLSSNKLLFVNMTTFVDLQNIQQLSLARNPIRLLHSPASHIFQQRTLEMMDLSHTELSVFHSKHFSSFIRLQKLNLSFSAAHTVSEEGFQFIPMLTELYLDGTDIKTFSLNIFQNLSALQTISAENYKLCCSEILPDNFDRSSCHAPDVGFSSCKDLLKSVAYRSFLWLVCSLSLIGNAFCFATRLWTTKSGAASGFSVFVLNLTVADFLMGNYIAVIGTADHLYRGQYLLHDDTWRTSSACKAAGCLSVLSSEVSALTVWLITLDRFIVLRFPFTTLRFRGTSASIASLLTWITGLCLAMIPLLPANSHWEFYSQSSICIPLSVTDEKFKGRMYSLSVFIIFNFGLFLLISCGQAFIYWSVQRNALASTTTRRSHDVTIARRLITVAVTDFMCWFPIGLCGLLALNRVPVPEEMNIALIVFILPLNSALNPFLYTFNSLADKARKANEVRMLQWLEVNAG